MTRKKTIAFRSNGRCLAYLRVSSGFQAESGLGLMAQGASCQREARKLGLTFRDIHNDTAKPPRPGHFTDSAVSAFKKSTLRKRAAGCAMLDHAERGDTIIIAKLDRGWRDVSDFAATATELTDRGIRLVVCDPPIDLGTATGRALAQFFAIMAEWESSRRSEAIIAALEAKKGQIRSKTASGRKTEESLDSDWRPPERAEAEAVAGESGRIFLYLRCSHRDSAASGLGLLAQADIGRNYANWLMENNSSLELAEVFSDVVVSASEFSRQPNLRLRPAGRRMDEELKAGDHVVFSNIDRAFRSSQDMANTIQEWLSRDIHVHFATENLCMDDATGQLLATVLVQFAQMQSRLTSARTKEARAIAAGSGRYAGGGVPCFWRVYAANGKKQLLLDRKKLAVFRYIKLLRRSRVSVDECLNRCEQLVAKREKRPAIPLSGADKFSKVSTELPKDYRRDKFGRAHPVVTRRQWQVGLPALPVALETWRKQAAERRKLREQKCEY